MVLATIFIFALQGGIGCERLSQFFHLLRLERHIGVSPTALRSLRARMESAIIEYQRQRSGSYQPNLVRRGSLFGVPLQPFLTK